MPDPGRTIDLSSGGVLFEGTRQLPVGLNVEMSISWPVLLHNVAPLQLVVSGRIVRSEGHRVAVRVAQHEFRTVSLAAERREMAMPNANAGMFPNMGLAAFNKAR